MWDGGMYIDNFIKPVEIYVQSECWRKLPQNTRELAPNQVSETIWCSNLKDVHPNDLFIF